MYPILVLAATVLVVLSFQREAVDALALAKRYQDQVRRVSLVKLAEGIDGYNAETGMFPASLAALVAAPGYEHLRGCVDPWQGYAVAMNLDDGVWRFTRVVVFSNSPVAGETPAAYLNTNRCGVGAFATAPAWCGQRDSAWWRKETRTAHGAALATQRIRNQRVIQKLADYFNTAKAFPNKDYAGNPLAAGSVTSMAALVGFAGTAKTCTGQYHLQGVPLECGDLYDRWGGAVGYHYLSPTHITLSSESPLTNSAGTKITIATDLNVL